MSYPQVLLWQRLRGSPMGIKFRRQHPIGPDYEADFFCAAAKLVIKVDGQIHPYSIERDSMRDRYMADRGLRVMRVPAAEVLRNADEAAAAIVSLAATPLHHSPSAHGPPFRGGSRWRAVSADDRYVMGDMVAAALDEYRTSRGPSQSRRWPFAW